jgi:biopolymer transport protein ExbD/biopolymer transport protein TolR
MLIGAPRRGGGFYEPVSDINVTPLVDVMLVLLIIFMVTAPMLAAGMRVDLPQARAAQPVDPKEPIIVTITKEGKVFLGHDEVSRDQLAGLIQTKMGADRNRVIHVRGDRGAIYGEVVGVMDELARNGLVRIALITNSRADVEDRPAAPSSAR